MLILASTALGANVAKNKDQNVLEGALKGAALGTGLGFAGGIGVGGAGATGAGLGSGTGNVIAQGVNAATAPNILPSTISALQGAGAGGAKVAATEGAKVAATETAKKAAADAAVGSITPTFTPNATTAIDAGRRSLLETAGNNLGTFKPAITPPETFVAPSLFERTGSNILATAQENPLKTAYFASSVGSALSPQQQTMPAAPYQPGSVQQTPSVEQSINQSLGDQPQFIPRPLFESMQGRSPEEMLLLQDQMMARGLV